MKKLVALALTGAMALSLAACGGTAASTAASTATDTAASTAESTAASTADTTTSGEPVTLRFSWWGGDSRHEATQKAIEAFMAANPNITVEAEFGAWDGWEENMATQISAKTAPDVMQINWNWIFNYSLDGSAFLDLNTVSDTLDLTQFPAAALAQCVQAGSQQAVPVAMTGRIFYWDKTTFDEAGIDTPKSLADLMAAGKTFQEKLGEDYYPLVCGEYDRMILMVYYLESKYGKAWVEDGQIQYTQEEIVDGMNFIKSLEDGHVIPTLKKVAGDAAPTLDKNANWIDGHYAGILEWDSSASKFSSAAEGKEIVVGEYFTDLGDYQGGFTKVSMGFAISANSAHPKEAAMLIDFLLNQDEGTTIMASERGIPCSAAALANCQKNDLLNKTVLEANTKVMDYCQFALDPYFEDAGLKNNPDGVYYKVFSKFSYGETTAEQAADELMSGVNEVLGN